MMFRLVLISLVLGVTLLIYGLSDVDLSTTNATVLFGIIAATYLLTIFYALALPRVRDPRRLADVQVAGDLLTTAILVHITGGAQSTYSFFFPLSIIGAATVRFRAGAVVVTCLSMLIYVLVALLGWLDVLPIPEGQRLLPFDLSQAELSRALALNLAAVSGVGVLAYNLGGQIQRTSASLESERSVAADLRALHEDIVRSVASGLLTSDLGGAVLTLNQAASEILSTSFDRAVGQPVERIIPGIETILATLAPHESARRENLLVRRRHRADLALGISIAPLRNNRDDFIGRVITFQDLTELREMEQQMKQAERLAVVGTLAAGVAHEIRNPLAAISGSIELLRTSPHADPDSRALMEIVNREVDRLNGLIRDLLDYTNPSPRELIRFDLVELVRETLQVFERDKAFEHVRIELQHPPAADAELTADPAKLRQVLWNLLRNAAEAAGKGGGRVRVVASSDADSVALRVEDDGPGIDAAHLSRVFDPFFTTKSRGTGLGLATCHNIVVEHGGTIRVETELGSGCAFLVRIPRRPETTRAPAPP